MIEIDDRDLRAEAFTALTGRGGPIILIEEEPTRRSVRDRTRETKR